MRRIVVVVGFVSVSLSVMGAARGAGGAARGAGGAAQRNDERPCASYIVELADSGLVLDERNADERRAPASMVKLMEMLLIAEGLDRGDWTLDTSMAVSAHAEHMGGTQVYLKAGETLTLKDLIPAIAVASANDAAMALAEGLWGTEEAYKLKMNERARELGMLDTEFHSVHGLPPDKGQESDLTTARDMAVLARECVRKPVVLSWTSQKENVFRPGEGTKSSTNELLSRLDGCDGLKTGYTRAAGFCITATAERDGPGVPGDGPGVPGDGIRIIAVVMGCPGNRDRFRVAAELIEAGFAKVERRAVLAKGDAAGAALPVTNCAIETTPVVAGQDVVATLPKTDADRVQLVRYAPDVLHAPLAAGTVVGHIQAELDGQVLSRSDLIVPKTLPAAGWRWKLRKSVPR